MDEKQDVDCRLDQCKSLNIVAEALSLYEVLASKDDPALDPLLFQESPLLNSYHHILLHHNDNESYSTLYNRLRKLQIKCQIAQCQNFHRNQKQDEDSLNEPVQHDINAQFFIELLDNIHCNYIHSFDIGYRVQQPTLIHNNYPHDDDDINSVECNDKTIQKLKQSILEKRTQHNIPHNTSSPSLRFSLSLSDIVPFSTSDSISNYHEIGHRWLYASDKQHDNNTKKKYHNFKEEVLSNTIVALSLHAYNRYYHKADTYLRHSDFIKSMKSTNENVCKQHGIKHNEKISIYHVLSIILWCDHRSLHTALRHTFNANVTDDERLNEYWHWSTHLIQSVECFGRALDRNETFYHHMMLSDSTKLNEYYFTDFSLKFCSPTSTTSQLPVAISNNMGNYGVIMQLQKHNMDIDGELRYIDCRFFSARSNEDEKLFFGGLYPLKVRNITLNDNGRSFKPLIDAMALFDHAIKGERYNNVHKSDVDMKMMVKIIHDLHCREKTLPLYALHIFDRFCNTKTEIIIDLHCFDSDYPEFKAFFMSNECVIRISKVCTMFRYCTQIKIVNGSNAIHISCTYLAQLCSVFERNDAFIFSESILDRVSFINITFDSQCNDKALEQYKSEFREKHYELTCKSNNDGRCDMLLSKEALEDSQEYREIRHLIQNKLALLLILNSKHDTDNTEKEYHKQLKQQLKTSTDLWDEVNMCSCKKDTTLDIYTHCESVQRLCVVLTAYKKVMESTSLSKNVSLLPIASFDNIYNIKEINDDFDHIKLHIDENSNTERDLRRLFIKQFECKLLICRRLSRRNRQKHLYPAMDDDETLFDGCMDKIHHYMVHYNDRDDDDEEEEDLLSPSPNNIPNSNRKHVVKQYIGKKEDDIWWNHATFTHDDSKHEDNDSRDGHIYRELVEKMGIFRWQRAHGFTTQQHQGLMHLKPKWANIKEEALYNNYYALSRDNWNQTFRKSEVFYGSFARRHIITWLEGRFSDQISGRLSEWGMGEEIQMTEIMTLKLYTDFDKLQYELKKCFRFDVSSDIFTLQTQTRDTERKTRRFKLCDRLSEFYWWRLTLLIVLNKFGKQMPDRPLYHGVNAKMVLNNGSRVLNNFYGPLSTSAAYHVARTFATAKGMVLQITTQYPQLGICRAFDAHLISDYPEEKEWLIGFVYLRILKVITRPLSKSWNSFRAIDEYHNNNNNNTESESNRYIPLSSKTRSVFFAVHLFRQQVFSMSTHSEYWLSAFLYLHCGYNEYDDNRDNDRIQKTVFVNDLQKSVTKTNKKYKKDDEYDRYYRILAILRNKFENFRRFPNKKQVLKIDNISQNLIPYFMDYEGLDIRNQERYVVSFVKIMKIFANIREIHFINAYPLNDDVLEKLIAYLMNGRTSELRKIKFIFYDKKEPLHPNRLNVTLLDRLKQQCNWQMKYKTIKNTGFQIQLYSYHQ